MRLEGDCYSGAKKFEHGRIALHRVATVPGAELSLHDCVGILTLVRNVEPINEPVLDRNSESCDTLLGQTTALERVQRTIEAHIASEDQFRRHDVKPDMEAAATAAVDLIDGQLRQSHALTMAARQCLLAMPLQEDLEPVIELLAMAEDLLGDRQHMRRLRASCSSGDDREYRRVKPSPVRTPSKNVP